MPCFLIIGRQTSGNIIYARKSAGKAQEGGAKALQQVAPRPPASNGGRQPGFNVQYFHARGLAEQQARARDRNGALEQGQSVQHLVLPGFTPNSMQRRQGFDESPAQAQSGSIDHGKGYAPSYTSVPTGGGDTSVGGSGRPGRPVYVERAVNVGNLPPNVSVAWVLNLVTFGPIESIRLQPDPSAFNPLPSALSASASFPSQENNAPNNAPSSRSSSSPSPSVLSNNPTSDVLPSESTNDAPLTRTPHVFPSIFLSFLDSATASAFVASASGKLYLLGRELRLTWPETISPDVAEWVKRGVLESDATRSIFIRPLPSRIATKSDLRDALESKFGYIESCKVAEDRTGERVGVANFLSIGAGIRWRRPLGFFLSPFFVLTLRVDVAARKDRRGAAVTTLQSLWTGANIQIKYSKDHCQRQPESQHTNTVLVPGSTGMGTAEAAGMGSPAPSAPTHQNSISSVAASGHATNAGTAAWLGGISASTTTADLCDAIRGGMLHRISLYRSKIRSQRCAPAHPTLTPPQFVTFIDPVAASAFYQASTDRSLVLHERRLEIA
ncbi:hypothetical protein C8F04DRAFT_1197409 [Mycena alexandri]|uniref:RRM domain-containing protein n=1 Tax=Mycena alexandri TaxID=1745969 RepID=A0AAD6S3S7_9AGAR|nr:hypothetical protein C8F04DRAFT_1197409 [Mycena alexandri]